MIRDRTSVRLALRWGTIAMGLALILSVVLYGMHKTITPYDERNHRKQLGLLSEADQTSSPSVEVALELVDLVGSRTDRAQDAQESAGLEIAL